jgi:hypothetical protein
MGYDMVVAPQAQDEKESQARARNNGGSDRVIVVAS